MLAMLPAVRVVGSEDAVSTCARTRDEHESIEWLVELYMFVFLNNHGSCEQHRILRGESQRLEMSTLDVGSRG